MPLLASPPTNPPARLTPAHRSCFTGGYSSYYEEAGACTLYSLSNGWTPSLDQQGPDTQWTSGAPPGKTLPFSASPRPGERRCHAKANA